MALFSKTTPAKKEKKEKTSVVRHARAKKKLEHGMAHEVLKAPWFSEKALIATEKGVYAFAVPTRATKADIAAAVKEVYNVAPKAIRIVNLPPKRKALRTRRGTGVRSARRKAYIYLNKGDTIQFA